MIKHLFFIILITFAFLLNAQSLMIGTGGNYRSGISQIGPNTRIYYRINENFCFGPEFTYFRAVSHDGESIELNENGFVIHYVFETEKNIGFYPLFGANYSVKESTCLDLAHNEDAWGASLGAGLHLELHNFSPYFEYKYITGDLSQSSF